MTQSVSEFGEPLQDDLLEASKSLFHRNVCEIQKAHRGQYWQVFHEEFEEAKKIFPNPDRAWSTVEQKLKPLDAALAKSQQQMIEAEEELQLARHAGIAIFVGEKNPIVPVGRGQ